MAGVSGLQYFTQTVEGRLHGGWYRAAGASVEIYARGQVRTVAVGSLTAEAVARLTLVEMVRGRTERRGLSERA